MEKIIVSFKDSGKSEKWDIDRAVNSLSHMIKISPHAIRESLMSGTPIDSYLATFRKE